MALVRSSPPKSRRLEFLSPSSSAHNQLPELAIYILPTVRTLEFPSNPSKMSSMRNAAPRRPHRERAQPSSRSKWGLLEKHKDYSLRAADYNLKKKKLSRLKEKARERNPDEFAFGMLRERRDGKTGLKKGEVGKKLSVEAVKLLKGQDAGYLGLVGGRVRREREKVEREVLGGEGWEEGGKRIVFVEGREGQRKYTDGLGREGCGNEVKGEEDETADGTEEPEARRQKSKKEIEAVKEKLREERAARKRRKRVKEARLVKLQLLRKREEDVKDAARELEWQRARMSNRVGGVNKHGVKWKIRERKK
jgi:U3 small nucleolar RNA-associated protein 11